MVNVDGPKRAITKNSNCTLSAKSPVLSAFHQFRWQHDLVTSP